MLSNLRGPFERQGLRSVLFWQEYHRRAAEEASEDVAIHPGAMPPNIFIVSTRASFGSAERKAGWFSGGTLIQGIGVVLSGSCRRSGRP